MTNRATKADVHFKSYVDGRLVKEFTEHRAVYPPTRNRLLHAINYAGSMKDVIQQEDGSFLAVLHTRTITPYTVLDIEHLLRGQPPQ